MVNKLVKLLAAGVLVASMTGMVEVRGPHGGFGGGHGYGHGGCRSGPHHYGMNTPVKSEIQQAVDYENKASISDDYKLVSG